jgi:hypothetical protein
VDVFTLNALARENPTPPFYKGPNDPGVFLPPDILQQVTAQGSVFTIGSDPRLPIPLDLELVMPAAVRRDLLDQLDHFGVTEASLFHDLDGISRWLVAESHRWGSWRGIDRT